MACIVGIKHARKVQDPCLAPDQEWARGRIRAAKEKHKKRIVCVVCGREEINIHRFWDCPHSTLFWDLIRSEKGAAVANPPFQACTQSELLRWLLEWFGMASEEDTEIMINGVYGLWLARNETREGRMVKPAHEIMESVWHFMQEWRAVMTRRRSLRELSRRKKWIPPEPGWIKANSDGAMAKNDRKGGGGVVLRGNDGALKGCCSHFFHLTKP